jgi:hypothetical protein
MEAALRCLADQTPGSTEMPRLMDAIPLGPAKTAGVAGVLSDKCLEFLAGEFGECPLAGWLDLAVEGMADRAGSEVGGEAHGQVRYADGTAG